MSLTWTAGELADKLAIDLHGDRNTLVRSISPPEEKKKESLYYFENLSMLKKHREAIEVLKAPLLVSKDLFSKIKLHENHTILVASQVKRTFIELLDLFDPYKKKEIISGHYGGKDTYGENVKIGPGCVISSGVKLGSGAVLMGNNFIGEKVYLGAGVLLYPGVSVMAGCHIGDDVIVHGGTVIGSDGFGYEMTENGLIKVPQIGNVVIESKVEIGANVTIDRATLGSTVIGYGTKIDNQVQVGHNVKIGKHCIVMAQVGIAGSCVLEDGVVLAGQVGIADHAYLEKGVVVAAKGGVHSGKRIAEKTVLAGRPAISVRQHHRITAAIKQLPDLLPEIKKSLKKKE